MRELREPILTEEGILRCPSAHEDSYHEFKYADGTIYYRRTTTAGEPYGEFADWRSLSADRIIDQYRAGGDKLKRWFHQHEYTYDRIQQMIEEDREREKATRREKRRR